VRITWLAPLLLAAVAVVAIADSDSGIPMWFRLRHDVGDAERRVAALVRDTEALSEQIVALESEPFALERAIREDLELALPGEVIVRFDPSAGRDW
jgi:cell division protein FtsB